MHQLFSTDSGPKEYFTRSVDTEVPPEFSETVAASTRAEVHVAATLLARAELAQTVSECCLKDGSQTQFNSGGASAMMAP